jgi:hypothetical protein
VLRLEAAGFQAHYARPLAYGASLLHVEWGHSVAERASDITVHELRPGADSSVTVEQVRETGLCQRVPGSLRASYFYDPTQEVQDPKKVRVRFLESLCPQPVFCRCLKRRHVQPLESHH